MLTHTKLPAVADTGTDTYFDKFTMEKIWRLEVMLTIGISHS